MASGFFLLQKIAKAQRETMKEFKHGGHIRLIANKAGLSEKEILDFSANINPLGLPEWFRPVVSASLSDLINYPDPDCKPLVKALCDQWLLSPDEVLFGNGSTELLYIIPRAFSKKRAVIPVPSYADYATACQLAGLSVEKLTLLEEESFVLDAARLQKTLRGDELVFLGQPNNPTGISVNPNTIAVLADANPDTLFVIDEAFGDFVEGLDRLVDKHLDNVLVLCSLTKSFAIPGLRLGFVTAAKDKIDAIDRYLPPWSVNTIAQRVGEKAIRDARLIKRTRDYVKKERERLSKALRQLPGLYVYDGEANYLFVRMNRSDMDAPELASRLLEKGIAIRVCNNYDGLDNRFFRTAVRNAHDNTRLVEALETVLCKGHRNRQKKRTPAVMLQGTSSNAGKSIMTAALCRILLQDGYRVAPFKAQNMSLNSYVTGKGGEMGRAQVVQAQACRLKPDVKMNPVLLKPNSDTGSQVIVMGKPVDNMDVNRYIDYKPTAFEFVKEAYDTLASEYDVIVIEGAGSPAEVNLKHHDIVNMKMAEYANAPVFLVGDIDRGGVFASFIGTMEVLSEWERACMAGFIVNRFRGQKDLLNDAVDFTEQYTGLPTYGVVPYIKNLGLPEEDSVSFKNEILRDRDVGKTDAIDIAVLDLPHISNFTDFDSLKMEPDVKVRVIGNAQDLGTPDVVILPGSKNVIGDMDYLFKEGFAERIWTIANNGKTEIVGVCGGFQMLGKTIQDPYGIESGGNTMKGLSLLNITTSLEREKTLKAIKAKHLETGFELEGYEIHHGKTEGKETSPIIAGENEEVIGLRSQNGMIWGTYLHGVFDRDNFRRWFIDCQRKRRGMKPLGRITATYDLEPAFNRLADVVRKGLRIADIYKRIGL
ncbi:cobyric acid synthase CobQ [delta proteobacterium NaphS2]|nr:cobyric acid synthase CobQ [delta proteobacterium NaphS2]